MFADPKLSLSHCWLASHFYVNFNQGGRVQFCPVSISMECLFTSLLHLIFIPIVTSQNHGSQSKEKFQDLSNSDCSDPWVLIGGGCYLFSTKPGTWEESKFHCSSFYCFPFTCHLVEITSQEEQLSLAGGTICSVLRKS